jgi:hypothetical protein
MYNQHAKLVLRPSRRKWGAILLFVGLIGILGLLMIRDGRAIGWLNIAVAVPLIPFICWVMTTRRMHLRLNASGFAFGTLRKQYMYSWSEIESFGVAEFASNRWVCFVFAPGYRTEAKVRAINQDFGGFDRFLPETYGMRAEELAKLLESWRLQYGTGG